ncbi:hypothetical protein PG994_000211 [Apiospora phragmitis]|uniref:Transcription factor domain-containing protein n=1 Tax=Apiospora phragmitis TaxID=2905665 RepID=A0ABR1X5N5_9PEZI
MNYTRKRALLACDFCRENAMVNALALHVEILMPTVSTRSFRLIGKLVLAKLEKTRDNNCTLSRIEDASPTAVVGRLSRIEALLEQQSQQLQQLSTHSSPTFSPAQRSASFSLLYQNTSSYPEPPRPSGDDPQDTHQFLIPTGINLTSRLFSAPGVREQLGGYQRNFFFTIEQNHALPSAIDPVNAGHLLPSCTPTPTSLLSRRIRCLAEKCFQNVPGYDIEAAICLCVYALGTITVYASREEEDESSLGLQFFKPALQIILHIYTWSFQPDLTILQALLLASTYFGYLGRPLHRGRMACFAARMFLDRLDIEGITKPPLQSVMMSSSEYFGFVSSLTAELDVVRSGIEPLGDKMSLPHSMHQDMSDTNDTISFVAEIALRRILNRILSSLYSTEGAANSLHLDPPVASPPRQFSSDTASPVWQQQGLSLQKLLALSSELNRQLEQWYDSIPDGLRPPKGIDPIETDRCRTLRVRYYEARHLIHRPFVMQAASQHQHQQQQQQQQQSFHPNEPSSSASAAATTTATDMPLPQVVVDECEVCIESCVAYLYNAVERLERRSAHLWSLAQHALDCVLVLVMAESCPLLRPLVPPVQPLRDALVARLKRWARSGSSFEADVAILESLRFRGDDAAARDSRWIERSR